MFLSAEIPSLFESRTNIGINSSCIVLSHNSMNFSLDISLDLTFFSFSTNFSVGSPLLSVPNGFSTLNPFILLYRAKKSC